VVWVEGRVRPRSVQRKRERERAAEERGEEAARWRLPHSPPQSSLQAEERRLPHTPSHNAVLHGRRGSRPPLVRDHACAAPLGRSGRSVTKSPAQHFNHHTAAGPLWHSGPARPVRLGPAGRGRRGKVSRKFFVSHSTHISCVFTEPLHFFHQPKGATPSSTPPSPPRPPRPSSGPWTTSPTRSAPSLTRRSCAATRTRTRSGGLRPRPRARPWVPTSTPSTRTAGCTALSAGH
jgi:hypothetical protein